MVAIGIITQAIGAMSKVKAKQWKGMKEGLAGVKKAAGSMMDMGKALGIVQEVLKPFVKLFEFMGKMIKGALAPVMKKLFDVLFSPEVMALIKVMADMLLVFIIPALDMLVLILDLLVSSGILEILTKGIQIFAQAIKFIWTGVLAGVFKAFQLMWKGLGIFFKWLWGLLKPVFDFIMLGFKLFLNVLIFFANMIINIVNLLTLGTLGLKNIPTLDTGGTVTKTGLAIIHKGEDIVPAAEAKSRKKGNGKTGGDTIINIASVRDPRDIRAIEEAIWRTS